MGSAEAHNLDQRDTYIAFDTATLSVMRARLEANNADADPSNDVPLIQKDDVIGVILKSTPGPGTDTGFGGYLTFYIPEGTQVVGAAYVQPDGVGGFNAASLKGPSIAPIGSGPVGATNTPTLAGLVLGPNVLGITAESVSGSGIPNGTIAGVYGDTGIFYSMDPDTAWQSWVNAGGYDGNIGTSDNSLTNNSGETIVPVNKWDAEQLIAFGLKKPVSPLIDPNGRGNAPWGLANAVAGPESAYAWEFDWETWKSNGNNFHTAIEVGPWQRIRYPGSQAALDTPGLDSSELGFVGVDASTFGHVLSGANPLPPTLDLTDGTSPTAVRFSYGGLELGRSEYGRIELKILAAPGEPGSPFDVDGCFLVHTDALGGDAGGENGGKDHLWRYYDPTVRSINACALIQKVASKQIVASGEVFSYQIDAINLGIGALTNVKVTDALPAGLEFLSAVPAPDSTGPLVWNIDRMDPDDPLNFPVLRTITVYVRATGSGEIFNTASLTSNETIASAEESVRIGSFPLLQPDKTVIPNTVPPGATVTYDLILNNVGSGLSAEPIIITENLPAGFTYVSMVATEINGGALPGGDLSVDASNPAKPVFEIGQGIAAGGSLLLRFDVLVSPSQAAGVYGNSFAYEHSGNVVSSGSLAPVTVGGAKIGDMVFRDWDGDGSMDAEDEGLPNVTVQLYAADGTTLLDVTSTDGNGNYFFTGLTDATYVVKVVPPAGYTQTFDADGPASANQSTVTLAFDEENFDQDFGYLPGGGGTVGDLVFEDQNGDGVFNGADSGIGGISVDLYEDSNGDGVVDAGDFLVGSTTTGGGGLYSFSGLAEGLDYLVDVDEADPDLAAHFSPETYAATTPALRAVVSLSGTDNSADFGYKANIPLNIGGMVFFDADGNGGYDVGTDTLLPNVTVTLYRDSNGDGTVDGPALGTADSDAAGIYQFGGLAPDTYLVEVDTGDPQVPSGSHASTESYIITLSGADVLNADFPFVDILSKLVDKSVATPGEQLLYSIYPSWTGPDLLLNAEVTDTVPNGTTLVSAGQGGVVGGGGATGTWDLGSNSPAVPGSHAGSPDSGMVSAAATDDSWMNGGSMGANSGTNYGSDTTMSVDSGGGGLGNGRAVAKFDLSGIPAGVTVSGATLKLEEGGSDASNRTIGVYQLTTDWGEGTVTWDTPWSSDGGDFDNSALATQTVGGNAEYSWTSAALTSLVSGWYQGTTDNEGLILGDDDLGGAIKQFATSEAGSGQPVLEISYNGGSPSPATTTEMAVNPVLLTDAGGGVDVTVSMTVTAAGAATGIAPNALNVIAGAHGAGATYVSGPTGSPVDFGAGGGSATFTWVYNVAAGTQPDELRFSGDATGTGATFASATSHGLLLTPPLTMTTTVISPDPGVEVVDNTAYFTNDGTLLAGDSAQTALSASIGDYLWSDLNGDGVQDFGEPGIEGVTVRLYSDSNNNGAIDGGDAEVANTLTDANGLYQFRGVTAGADYTVGYDLSGPIAGYLPTSDSDADGGNSVHDVGAITTGLQYVAADFGLRPPPGTTVVSPSSIGDTLWIDGNEDGVVDSGETPIADVTLRLYLDLNNDGAIDGGDVLLASAASDSGGQYGFGGLYAGDYLVEVDTADPEFPAGLEWVSGGANGSGLHDVSLAEGVDVTTADFGYNWAGSIAGSAYYDDDANMVQDLPGETKVADVTVLLYEDANGNGKFDGGETPVGFTQTDGSGDYLFENLPPGDYVVKFDESTVESRSMPGVFGRMVSTTGSNVGVTLGAGVDYTGADAGFIEAAEVEGHVFHDVNGDGFLGAGEPRLPGVEVTLSGTDFLGDPVLLTFDSDSDGEYKFLVAPGVYTVSYDPGDGAIPITLSQLTTTSSYNVTANAGDEIGGLDFGRDNPGSVGDTIFADADGDGSMGAAEPGLGGVTVLLFASDGTTLLASAVTDANGGYLFGGLADADFVVEVDTSTLPAGYSSTPTADPDALADSRGTATVSLGGADLGMDFGYQPIPATHTLSGTVFNDDSNGDGILDGGEPGLGGVRVMAGIDADGDGDIEQAFATVTASDGSYSFTGIPNGANVTLNVLTGTLPGDAFTPTGDRDSPAPTGDNEISLTNITGDATVLDFGYEEVFGSIAGSVVVGDGNGVAEGGEAALATVTITLTFAGADGVLGTSDDSQQVTATDGSGDYSFTGLAPGIYQIVETNPAGYASLADADGGNPDNIVTSLALGATAVDQDFEDALSAGISGRVVLDVDVDGDLGEASGEAGIAGVTVTLWTDPDGDGDPSDGFAKATTTSGGDGSYGFTDVVAGDYVVVESDPADHGSTGDRDGTGSNSANEIAVVLAGVDSTGNDFLDSPFKTDSFADWQTEQAGALAGQNEPDDNPDGDIYDNALEYALCLPPGSGSNPKPFCVKLFSGSGTVDAIFFRRRGSLSDVTYTLETATVLGDPTAWTDWVGVAPTVDTSSPGIPVVAEKVTFSDLPATVGSVGFVRLRVELAGDSTGPHHSQVFGWHTVTNTASCETCSFPYAPKEAFSSTPSAVSADNLTLTVVGTPLLGSGLHYIEILSGALAGHRFDVASVAADTVVLDGSSARDTLSPVPDLTGAPFALRPHTTLDSIAPPALFAADNNPSAGDRILAFDGAGWTTYWIYDLGGTQPKQWTDVSDGGLADAGGTVVDAPEAFFLHPKSGDVALVMVGVVREWPFACPLQTGYNLVGSGYPFVQSPAGREMLRDDSVQGDTIAGKNWFDGSNDPLAADQLMFWNGDAAPGSTGYHTYFRVYLGAGFDYWTDQTDSALADSDADSLFGRSRGAFIDMMQGHDRSAAADVWVWPLPWSADAP